MYFNHSIHVDKGVGCVTCHGQVDQMPLMFQKQTLLMEWCIDCHRKPEKYLRPRDEVFNMTWNARPTTPMSAIVGRGIQDWQRKAAHELLDVPPVKLSAVSF